jgi:hypothetical protein
VDDPGTPIDQDRSMTTTSAALRRTTTWNRPLMVLVAGMAVLTLITAVGTFADSRVLTGAPIWLKPFKFSVSIALYAFTLAWMLSLLPRRNRLVERAATVIVGLFVIEMVVIVAQVIRGQTSHFNATTPLNSALFDLMGLAIMLVFVAQLVIAIAVLRQRIPDRVAAMGVRLGLGVSLLGMLAALPMVVPGAASPIEGISGAHSVGVPDGGPGLPVVGWSTAGGDYRVGHFIGLHALQALPILALVLIRFAGRLSERTKVRLLLVAGLGYAALTVLLSWQAMRGQPLIHPDAVTLTAAAVLALTVSAAGLLVVRRGRRDDMELAA